MRIDIAVMFVFLVLAYLFGPGGPFELRDQ